MSMYARLDEGGASHRQGPCPELVRLLSGELRREDMREIQALLQHPLFLPQEGLTAEQAVGLSYRRAHYLGRALGVSAEELRKDARRLFAIHEWVSLVDCVSVTVMSIHYCLALGSLAVHGEGRPELEPFVRELERFDATGVFLATELGYGNSVASLETRAVYDAERREFTLHSPSPQSLKFMPNTAFPVSKLAVVMARLISGAEDHGVFPFLVRVRASDGKACSGVHIAPLTEKPGSVLDNAITRFDHVRLPKSHLLAGSGSVLHDDGRFESCIPSHRKRFLASMERVQTGRVCFTSAAAAVLRAATWICMRYTAQRLSSAPGKRRIPLLRYRNVQRDVFGGLATAFAVTFAVRSLQSHWLRRNAETEAAVFTLTATLKAVVTAEVSDVLPRLRERCGAVGIMSANRIMEYWNQVQGIVTAEGDNQLMLLKAGRQLFDRADCAAPALGGPADSCALNPNQAVSLFRFREGRMKQALKHGAAEARRRSRDALAIWNDNVHGTLALAKAHGTRLMAEYFAAALADCQDETSARALRTLFSLWALDQVDRHGGWFLSQGCITGAAVENVESERDRLCVELEPHALELVEAFGIDNTVLKAPIAEDDYVAAYYALARGDAGGPTSRTYPTTHALGERRSAREA
jgi:acyl-CoA oxidase